MHKNSDPALRREARIRSGIRAIAVAAGILLLASACSDGAPEHQSAPTTTVATPEVQSNMNDIVNAKAKSLAERLLDLSKYQSGKSAAASSEVVSSKDGVIGNIETSVTVETGSLLDDRGIYQLTAQAPKNADGQIDTDNVNVIYITIDSRKNGEPGDIRGQLFSMSIIKDLDGDWTIHRFSETKGIESFDDYLVTNPNKHYSPNDQDLTPEWLDSLDTQANIAIDWAQAAAPVNVVPYK